MVRILWLSLLSSYMPRVHFPSDHSIFPILVFHFFKDLQHHPVNGFSLTISLWVVWCRPSMLDVIRISQVLHVFVYEWGPIVIDQSLGDSESCNDVFSNEFCYGCSSGFFQRDSFYPFCKVLSGY